MNVKNRTLFVCDNLPMLRGLNTGCIDLIAVDPPFNSKKMYNAAAGSLSAGQKFDDRWRWDDVAHEWYDLLAVENAGVREVIEAAAVIEGGTAGADGIGTGRIRNSMAAYLCWMAPRVIEMRRVLKPSGSIFLHCDDSADSYLRLLMDAVFGRGSFQNAVVWQRSARSDGRRFGRTHDTILFYAGPGATWNGAFKPYDDEYVQRFYRERDERGAYQRVDLTGDGIRNGESGREWTSPSTGLRINPTDSDRHWAAPRTGRYAGWIEREVIPGYRNIESVLARLDALDATGMIHFPKRGVGWPRLKRYIDATEGQPINDVFTDIRPVSNLSEEATGWKTKKPIALYERLIEAASNPGDIVLDAFCGCGTTPIAAERTGRGWIGCDLSEVTETLIRDKMGKLIGPEALPLFAENFRVRKQPPRRTDIETTPGDKLRLLLWERQAHKCANPFCTSGELRREDIEHDHRIPRSRGGDDTLDNALGLCSNCNRRKGKKAWGEFLAGEAADEARRLSRRR